MWLELLIAVLTALVLWEYLCKRRHVKMFKENNIRGPPSFPLIGSSLYFIKERPDTLLKMLDECIRKYGKTFQTWGILSECAVNTSDAKLVEAILSSTQVITKNKLYDLLQNWLGTGLLLSTGKKWYKRRKIITPAFHFKILEQFVEVFDQQSRIMVKKLEERADGKTAINIYPVVCLTALDIIAETSMGVKVNAQMDPDFPYVKSVTTANEINSMRFMKPLQRNDSVMRVLQPGSFRKLQDSIKLMHDFTTGIIETRRATLEASIADGSYKPIVEDTVLGSKKRMALLDVLLQSSIDGSPLSNQDIREEVDTFMFEGHDTTTSGIAHTLYLIARHPAEQQRLFDEIRSVLGDDKDRTITLNDLQQLKYLEYVIKESLRLFPPVPIIGRCVEEDVVLNGTFFAANTNVFVLIYNLMRDPDYFPEPHAFKPERFYAENSAQIDPFAYVPFSAGSRNCIGQKFAMLEMKSTISKMLRHYELLPLGEEVRPQMNIVLRSANGIHLGLKPRVY